jgi:hypothetical protein
MDDILTVPDWNEILQGNVRSAFVDGSPSGVRTLPDGSQLDLDKATNMLDCGKATAAATRAERLDRRATVGHEQSALAALRLRPDVGMLPTDTINSKDYVVVWIADDPSETDNDPTMDGSRASTAGEQRSELSSQPGLGVLAMHAEAYGPVRREARHRGDHRAHGYDGNRARLHRPARTGRTEPRARKAACRRRQGAYAEGAVADDRNDPMSSRTVSPVVATTPRASDGRGSGCCSPRRRRALDDECVRAARSAAVSQARRPERVVHDRHGSGMLSDADGAYYDPNQYKWSNQGGDLAWQTALGLTSGVNIANQNNAPYYRKFVNRTYTAATNVSGVTYDFAADSIVPVGNLASGYSSFYEPTRLMIARRAITQVIDENTNIVRFGLMKTRQTSATWGTAPNNKLANDAALIAAAAQLTSDTGKSSNGKGIWYYMKTTVSGNNAAAASTTYNVVQADASSANTSVRSAVAIPSSPSSPTAALQVTGGLIPASNTTSTQTDRPLGLMLDDAKTEVTRLITADTQCRNNVIVMVVAGGEGTTTSGATAATTAAKGSNFLNISSRHVPVYVIAIAPLASESANLALIATNSGGRYFEITKANIDATPSGSPVPQFVSALNYAVQHAFQRYAECNSNTTESEFQVTSPIAGTVDLEDAKDINGASLSNTKVYDKEGNLIPQRTNVLITTAFELPGFEARLRAFRVYKPVSDSTKSSGYKFSQDGTRLWVACAPGTTTSGACSSLTTTSRNIYTSLPDGTMVKFDSTEATTLGTLPRRRGDSPIDVQRRPMSSTPCVRCRSAPMDLGHAGHHGSRHRSIRRPMRIIRASPPRTRIAARSSGLQPTTACCTPSTPRLGIEVWAYIPFNMLPR